MKQSEEPGSIAPNLSDLQHLSSSSSYSSCQSSYNSASDKSDDSINRFSVEMAIQSCSRSQSILYVSVSEVTINSFWNSNSRRSSSNHSFFTMYDSLVQDDLKQKHQDHVVAYSNELNISSSHPPKCHGSGSLTPFVSLKALAPSCGDLIQINRGLYSHWALYIGCNDVIHVAGDRGRDVTWGTARVLQAKLTDVVGNSLVRINNKDVQASLQ